MYTTVRRMTLKAALTICCGVNGVIFATVSDYLEEGFDREVYVVQLIHRVLIVDDIGVNDVGVVVTHVGE